ncbi:MAG: helix-turn-helix transcriptional regulator [Verrucomicrobiae bacterium]|nr:helix-turn-helix transcriptional regulator [Verrucomicrobiae bacterium]
MADQLSHFPLYGEINRGSFWVLNLAPVTSGKTPSIALSEDQAVFVCLRSGNAWIEDGNGDSLGIAPSEMVIGLTGKGSAAIRRNASTDGVVVGFRKSVFQQSLEPHRPTLIPQLAHLIFSEPSGPLVSVPLPDHIQGRWTDEFRNPPVEGAAATFWFESKVREFIAICCFNRTSHQSEFFCSRQKRLAADRIGRTRAYIEAHFDEPLDLTALANHVDCSTHYLSRTFSEATGKTISQFLREVRIEKAARLLSSGRYNVSEAAVEVGYQSLSHFSKAFLKEKGCLPSRFNGA